MARYTSAPAPVDDYRGESDHGTLMRACEVMADKIRMKGVLRHHNKQQTAEKSLNKMLARHRAGKVFSK